MRRGVLGALLLGGCSLNAAQPGEACTRTAQCEPGLACIEGRCSDDLSRIASEGTVPDLMPMAPDAGLLGDAEDDAGG